MYVHFDTLCSKLQVKSINPALQVNPTAQIPIKSQNPLWVVQVILFSHFSLKAPLTFKAFVIVIVSFDPMKLIRFEPNPRLEQEPSCFGGKGETSFVSYASHLHVCAQEWQECFSLYSALAPDGSTHCKKRLAAALHMDEFNLSEQLWWDLQTLWD